MRFPRDKEIFVSDSESGEDQSKKRSKSGKKSSSSHKNRPSSPGLTGKQKSKGGSWNLIYLKIWTTSICFVQWKVANFCPQLRRRRLHRWKNQTPKKLPIRRKNSSRRKKYRLPKILTRKLQRAISRIKHLLNVSFSIYKHIFLQKWRKVGLGKWGVEIRQVGTGGKIAWKIRFGCRRKGNFPRAQKTTRHFQWRKRRMNQLIDEWKFVFVVISCLMKRLL